MVLFFLAKKRGERGLWLAKERELLQRKTDKVVCKRKKEKKNRGGEKTKTKREREIVGARMRKWQRAKSCNFTESLFNLFL